jgi:CO/xanthine dehydrogenase FAD-binding subunit
MYELDIITPNSLEEALIVKNEQKGALHILAGGTDLLIDLLEQESLGNKPYLLNLSKIKELKNIKENHENIEIGSLTTHNILANSQTIQSHIPSLSKAASLIGSPQIRNQGTIGGNIVNASPAADLLPVLYAREADIEIATIGMKKLVPIERFIKGPGSVNINPSEIVTKIIVPKLSGYKSDYICLRQRKAVSINKVSLGVEILISNDRKINDIKIALGAVSPTIVRGIQTEKLLKNRVLTQSLLKEACELIKTECVPIDDIRSNSQYRSAMVGVLLERFLRKSII